jgi:hypothetical protein
MMVYLSCSTLSGNRKNRIPPLGQHKSATIRIGTAIRAGLEARRLRTPLVWMFQVRLIAFVRLADTRQTDHRVEILERDQPSSKG